MFLFVNGNKSCHNLLNAMRPGRILVQLKLLLNSVNF